MTNIQKILNKNCYNSEKNYYQTGYQILKNGISCSIESYFEKDEYYAYLPYIYITHNQFNNISELTTHFNVYFHSDKIWLFEDDLISISINSNTREILGKDLRKLNEHYSIKELQGQKLSFKLKNKGKTRTFFEGYYHNPNLVIDQYCIKLQRFIKSYLDDDITFIKESFIPLRFKQFNITDEHSNIDFIKLSNIINDLNNIRFGFRDLFFYSYFVDFFDLHRTNMDLYQFCRKKMKNRKEELTAIFSHYENKKGSI